MYVDACNLEHDIELVDLIEESLSGTNYDVANLMHHLMHHMYVCGTMKTKMWFVFDGRMWRRNEIGPYVEISSSLVDIIKIYKAHLERKTEGEIDTQHEEAIIKTKIDGCERLIEMLKMVKVKEAIIKECCYLFYDPEFIEKLDRNKNLVCFQNGVYDMVTKTIRDPSMDDYISLFIDEDVDIDEDIETEDFYTKIVRFNRFRDKILAKRKPAHAFDHDGWDDII